MHHKDNQALIEELKSQNQDISIKSIPTWGSVISICYIQQLIDQEALARYILEPIIKNAANDKEVMKAETVKAKIIPVLKAELNDDADIIIDYILSGQAVIFFSNERKYIAVDIKNTPHRSISEPEFRYSYRGPREAFIEELDTNLSLIRKRLKDRQLRIEKMKVGKRSLTDIAVLYVGDIVNPACVREVKKRIADIDTDCILDSGELQNYIKNNQYNLFPQVGVMEKPYQVVDKLMEGKVAVLVDGSCTVLCMPKTFMEFFYAEDDRYEDRFFGLFMRIVRYIGFFVSITATSVYIALSMYHPDAMPATYIVVFAQMRSKAPFSALIAVLILELIVELVREALLRVPKKIGTAVAIVGAIIIGQAASSSGVFSPLLLIIVSVGFLASFAQPDYTITNTFRILKFLLIFLTGFFGFYGASVGAMFILTNLVSVNSFGVPYFAPFSPYNRYDYKRSFIFGKPNSPFRQQYMPNIDDSRTRNENIPKKVKRIKKN